MVHPVIEKQLLHQLSKLALDKQQQVLAFAESLAQQISRGVSGTTYRRFAGAIDADDVARMSASIEEGCERVDRDEW